LPIRHLSDGSKPVASLLKTFFKVVLESASMVLKRNGINKNELIGLNQRTDWQNFIF